MNRARDRFDVSGPTHLKAVDWNNSDHRRSVAASLVQGVYVQENDRQQQRQEPHAPPLAQPWWEFFHFQLSRVLLDNVDKSIFGAIYEFISPVPNSDDSARKPPKYVVAFRGNILPEDTFVRDMKLSIQYYLNILHMDSRFVLAMGTVKEIVSSAGAAPNLWLAGHSLGAGMALGVGKNMTKLGHNLETYLFNPPFTSLTDLLMKWTKNEAVRDIISFSRSGLKAGFLTAAKVLKHNNMSQKDVHDPFVASSNWFPHLFVNPDDPISSGYIPYFENRIKMEKIGAGDFEKLATKKSMRSSIVSGALAMVGCEPEDLHLLPSAYLYKNLGNVARIHGPEQWWNPNTHCQLMAYQYKE